MTDPIVSRASNDGKTLSLVEDTVVEGDLVTTVTETVTRNADRSITTTTTVDKTDHADHDNHMTTISQCIEPSSSDPDLVKKIVRQIEYYFSDGNLIRDKYLQHETKKEQGWIPLSTLTTFKRLASLTTDFPTILNALKTSSSGLLQLDEPANKLRRHPDRPLPSSQAELELALRNRTVYVQGFPSTNNEVTIDHLLAFFGQHGSTDNIQMRRQVKGKDFDGSVWVVFPSEGKAQQFVDESKHTPVKYNDGSVLECFLQTDADAMKAMGLDLAAKETRWDDKQARKEKKQGEVQQRTNENLEKLNHENCKGALIHLTGMSTETTRELIKEKFNPFTKLPWIDFNKGDAEAWIRLNEANTATDVLEKVLAAGNGKLVIDERELVSRVVQGDEEDQFCREANEKRAAQRTKKRDHFSGGKRGGRSKRGNRNGYKRTRDQDQTDETKVGQEDRSSKKVKVVADD